MDEYLDVYSTEKVDSLIKEKLENHINQDEYNYINFANLLERNAAQTYKDMKCYVETVKAYFNYNGEEWELIGYDTIIDGGTF